MPVSYTHLDVYKRQGFISNSDNWQYVDGYIDEGISGTSVNKRGSFLRMIDDAHLDKFDFIITKEVSRFARNTLDSIKYTQDLLAHGIGVFFQSDNINTLMPDSELRLKMCIRDSCLALGILCSAASLTSISSGISLKNEDCSGLLTKISSSLALVMPTKKSRFLSLIHI